MDTIRLDKVVPVFLEKEKITSSQVWNQTFDLNKNEKIQIVAPSGSGKTSLIHFLYGMRKEYKGNILFDDQNLATITGERLAALRTNNLSIIFQDLRLFGEHTALENVLVKKTLKPYAAAASVENMFERLSLTGKINQEVKNCSYGEQQRIAIIRALQQPFDFLLLDEPFSHLDDANTLKAMELIEEEVAKRQAALVLADLKPLNFFTAHRIIYL